MTTQKPRESVTWLGELKDCHFELIDGKKVLRINAGSVMQTNYVSLSLSPEHALLLARCAEENQIRRAPIDGAFSESLPIDLGWIRFLQMTEIASSDIPQIPFHPKDTRRIKVHFDLSGIANSFLGVTELTAEIERYSLAQLLPNHERVLMRERYMQLGRFRRWLWRRIIGTGAILGLPGAEIKFK